MHYDHAFSIGNEVRKFSSALSAWERQVCSARDLHNALKLARFEPVPSPILRGMRHLTSTDRSKALRQIDEVLTDRRRPQRHLT